MKIRDYIEWTNRLSEEYEVVASRLKTSQNEPELASLLLDLYDAIELRSTDVEIWTRSGLTVDDDIPMPPMRVIFPDFTMNTNTQESK